MAEENADLKDMPAAGADEPAENVSDEGTAESQSEHNEETGAENDAGSSLTAVIRVGGKQHVIRSGQPVVLPSQREFPEQTFEVNDILMARSDRTIFGQPTIAGAYARLSTRGPVNSRRQISFKRRRRKGSSKRTKGFRTNSVTCTVDEIFVPGLGHWPDETAPAADA